MTRKLIILYATCFLLLFSSCVSYVQTQSTVYVEALSDDISYDLDLRAVASIFADSRDLEDFERRLNSYDARISNLDLNNDGLVDYLRVIEVYENGYHLVVLQAVLGYDIYQDVATIVVENKRNNKVNVQIVGAPYIYGPNYIIEPVYYRTPVIYSYFWSPYYTVYHSPYYWGYYPTYYHRVVPVRSYAYMNHVNIYVNTSNRYSYKKKVSNQRTVDRMYNNVRRNDYSQRYPQNSFNSRNSSVTNRRQLETRATSPTTNTRSSNTTTNTRQSTTNSTTNTRQNTTNSSNTRSNSSGTVNSNSNTNSTRSSSGSTTTSPSTNSNTRSSGTSTSTSSGSSSSNTRSSGTSTTTAPNTNSNTRSSSTSTSSGSSNSNTRNSSSSSSSSNSSNTNVRSSGSSTNSSSGSSTRSSGSSSSSGSNTRSSGSSSSNTRR